MWKGATFYKLICLIRARIKIWHGTVCKSYINKWYRWIVTWKYVYTPFKYVNTPFKSIYTPFWYTPFKNGKNKKLSSKENKNLKKEIFYFWFWWSAFNGLYVRSLSRGYKYLWWMGWGGMSSKRESGRKDGGGGGEVRKEGEGRKMGGRKEGLRSLHIYFLFNPVFWVDREMK